jgi:hypothetical protein
MKDHQLEIGERLADAFAQMGRELGKAFGGLAFVTAAQGAMGWMVQDDADNARQALAKLTDEQRAKVAEAARKLAELANE